MDDTTDEINVLDDTVIMELDGVVGDKGMQGLTDRPEYYSKTLKYDYYFLTILDRLVRDGVYIPGRTGTRRKSIRGQGPVLFIYDGKTMPVTSLREISPKAPIAETLWYLTGSSTIYGLYDFNPKLARIWSAWADDDGSLGGAYGEAFMGYGNQFNKIISLLTNEETRYTTHAIMTTLIPEKFPIPGNTYGENVEQGKFSLMPCAHTYHFLYSDNNGGELNLNLNQRSGDIAVGVYPHNAIQAWMMLHIVSKLTKLKPGKIYHTVNDVHYYENQEDQIRRLLNRKPIETVGGPSLVENVEFPADLNEDDLLGYYHGLKVGNIAQLSAIVFPVDS